MIKEPLSVTKYLEDLHVIQLFIHHNELFML